MKKVRIILDMDVEDRYINELSKIVDHHIDYLIDLSGNPEINRVYNCKMEVIEDDGENSN